MATAGLSNGLKRQQEANCGRTEGASREAIRNEAGKAARVRWNLAGMLSRLSFSLQTKRIHLLTVLKKGRT